MSFPAIDGPNAEEADGASPTLLPVTFESCVAMFVPCLGEDTAHDICSDAAGDGIAQGWAGVAAVDSPWATTALPSLFDAEAEANRQHRKCVLADQDVSLRGCPSRSGKMVHVNTDVWDSVAEIDQYVADAVMRAADNSTDASFSLECAEATRTKLCASNMPLCNEFGNPIKLKYSDCVDMIASCPEIAEKDESMYGLPSSQSQEARARCAAAVCSDSSNFFTRNFVGAHPVTCGYEAVMSPSNGYESTHDRAGELPWHQNVSVVAPVAVFGGVLCGRAGGSACDETCA